MKQNGTRRTTILVADDHKVVCQGIAGLMRPFFDVVAEVTELGSLIPSIKQHRPDVVLLDLTFGGVSSLPTIQRALERKVISTRFVVLTAHESAALERAAFNAGAHAFLLKGVGTQELRLAVEAARADRRYLANASPSAADRADRSVVDVEGVLLRRKQIQVLLLLHEGLSRMQVAQRLGVGVRGVDFHLRIAKEATGLRKLQLLLKWAAERKDVLEAILSGEGTVG
jgi:DNA-binding NarL/FixJ family response regulator